jgi:hypothetical protein
MRLVRLALLSAALAAAAPACTTDGGASFYIVQNQVPGEGCTISPDLGSSFLTRGVVEGDYASGYLFTPVVQSLYTASDNPDVNGTIQVHGADVSLSFPRGELDDIPTFRQMFSMPIQPGGTGSTAFYIIPGPYLADIAAAIPDDTGVIAVEAKIEMFGSADGRDVDAEPYYYNVDVCRGCLATFYGPCAELPDGITFDQGGACDIFQDARVDCCMDPLLGDPDLDYQLCPGEVSSGA